MKKTPKPTLYIENPRAPELNLDVPYSLSQFAKVASDRYNLPYHTFKRLLALDISNFENKGVLIDTEKTIRRVYIQPEFTRWFVFHAIPKLREGFPIQMILKQ